MTKKIAITFIGTGNYIKFFPQYYETLMEYFVPECEKDFFVFTDGDLGDDLPDNVKMINSSENPEYENYLSQQSQINNLRYSPNDWYNLMYNTIGGLRRFGEIKKIENQLKNYDWYAYIDADMYCCDQIIAYEEFFNDEKPFFGVQHPTFSPYWKKHQSVNGGILPFDRNKLSYAYVSEEMEKDDVYLQGCIWGGKIPEIFELIDELDRRIKLDLEKNVLAKAHDESHLNRYRMENIDKFHVLCPNFAKPGNYPDHEFTFPEARIIHSPQNKHQILNS